MKFSFEKSHCIQNPMLVLLTLLTAVPTVAALVDCQTACRRCRVAADPRAAVEIYCTMCQECRWKARRRGNGRRADAKQDVPMNVDENFDDVDYMYGEDYEHPDADLMFEQGAEELRSPGPARRPPRGPPPPVGDDEAYSYSYEETGGSKDKTKKGDKSGYYKALEALNIPDGCPVPPICSDSEAPPSRHTQRMTSSTSSTTTTTTTTTTQPPTTCPPIPECIETTTRQTRRTRTTPQYYLYDYPTPPLYPPSFGCMPCMPMCPCPPYPPQPGQQGQPPTWPPLPGGGQQQAQQQQEMLSPTSYAPTTPRKLKLNEEITPDNDKQSAATTTPSDFMYVYVGVPKDLAQQV